MKYLAVFSAIAAVVLFINLAVESQMLSYLSSEPKVCINCHPMNTLYETWAHSSHRNQALCIDCHLPHESFLGTMLAKAEDGIKHATAMTLKTYGYNIRISDTAAGWVQGNCIRCHDELVSQMRENSALYTKVADSGVAMGRRCWDCHRDVPHGIMRNITATQNAFAIRAKN
ncbi:MAG: cytochrome c nitrite reductase small subunit [Desulfobulbus sp.]|jgi:cytochrome c nitrite reductase small subunit